MADFGSPGVGGIAGGLQAFRTYEIALDEQARRNRATDLDAQQLEIDRAHKQSIMRLHNSQVDSAERSAKAEEQRIAALAGVAPTDDAPSSEQMRDTLLQQASTLARLGDTKGAADAAKAASQIDKDMQTVATSGALEKQRIMKSEMDALEDIQQLFAGVNSKQSYDQALMIAQSRPWAKDFPPPKELMNGYNPALVQGIVKNSKAEIDRRKLAIDEADLAGKERNRQHQQAYRDARLGQIDRSIEDRREIAANRAKTGTDPKLTDPPPALRMRASNELKRMKVDLSKPDLDAMAYDIAAEAKRRSETNRALSMESALEQVISEARLRGDIEEPSSFLGMSVGKGKYTPKRGTEARPAEIPATKEGLKSGTIYQTSQGPWRYLGAGKGVNGSGFEPVKAPATAAARMNPLDPDQEGDDE